jgi:hypothetical protein
MTPITIVIEPATAHAWTLTCPDVPGWSATATSPLNLGLLIRDAYGLLTNRLRYLERVRATIAAGHEAYLCHGCAGIITRPRVVGVKPSICADCRSTRHLQPVTSA